MKKKGFTLTEFIVIMAVIGILVGIATPSFVLYFRSIAEQNANQVAADLKDLREISISNSAEVVIQKSGNYNLTATINYPDPDIPPEVRHYRYTNIEFHPASVADQPVPDIGGNVESDGFTFPNNTIVFLRSGAVLNSGAIYIRDIRDSRGYAISITLSGRVKLWKWNGGWR